jgi:hypothetical protein
VESCMLLILALCNGALCGGYMAGAGMAW